MPTGRSWRFQQWVHTGSVYLDDYAEFTGSGDVQTFTYDALDRLMTAQSANGAYLGYSESYQYSPIGNLIYKTGQGTYTYPTSGPNSVRPHAVTSAGGHTYAYDANGNMTTYWYADVSQTLVYSAENRLASVTRNGKTTAYFYNGDGVLVKKTAYENLAAGVPATSDTTLFWPAVVTNGDTWANSGNGNYGEFAYTGSIGLRYVQLDLGGAYTVDQIKVWHYAADGRIYNNTKTQVSADGVTWYTVFDSAVSGTYPETAAGKTHTFAPRTVHYVRDYLNGSSSNSSNHWVEIEVWGNRTTVYVNALYEKDVTANLSTKYYYFGSQRIAMRRGSTLTYLHGDHLGSASLTTNASGAKVSLMRYMPYGELRVGGLSTDRQYTGQRREASLGFYDYVARQYDSALGRFLQADTIIPNPANPQSLNRYSYVLNSPLRYTDPSGHRECGEFCDDNEKYLPGSTNPSPPAALPVLTSNLPTNALDFLTAPWKDLYETYRINWLSLKLWGHTADPLVKIRKYGWYYDVEYQYGVKGDIRALYSEYALLSPSAIRYYPGGADSAWWIEADTTTSPSGRYAAAWRTPKLREVDIFGINISYRVQMVLTLDNRDALLPRLGVSLEAPFVLKDDGWSTRASPYYSCGVNIHGRRAIALAVEGFVVAAIHEFWPAIVSGGVFQLGYAK